MFTGIISFETPICLDNYNPKVKVVFDSSKRFFGSNLCKGLFGSRFAPNTSVAGEADVVFTKLCGSFAG